MKTTMLILIALLGLSTAAQAQPPEFAQRNRIKYLAAELAEAAHHAHQNAEYCANLSQSTRALEALHELDRQARRFSRKVGDHSRRSYRTEEAYWDLVQTYRYARRFMRHGHTAEVVLQDMRRVGRLLSRMAYVYEGYGRHGYYGSTWRNDHHGSTWQNDSYRGDDYDDGYYGKKSERGAVKTPRRSTPRH